MSIANPENTTEAPVFHHAHHFQSAEHQYSSSKQGIWLFMVTEILMFGGLFVAYLIYHSLYPEIFHHASQLLNVKMGAVNTVVLITSSLTMALSIYFLQINDTKKAAASLAITFACAMTFMVVKYFEYSHKIHMGTVPGNYAYILDKNGERVKPKVEALVEQSAGMTNRELEEKLHMNRTELDHYKALIKLQTFNGEESTGKNWPLFFGFYFVMTGLHGIHVLMGAGLIFWLLLRTIRGDFSSAYYTPVEGVGLFWHIVDLIWIYLFPLLYLVG
ncbi:MAG: cytochrome c oxidase subunit 3 family protein [Leptospiraceae bacterium]|nr:cytochrome c oxidase subunit 3 family protein [Leptospiraceae bacterium]